MRCAQPLVRHEGSTVSYTAYQAFRRNEDIYAAAREFCEAWQAEGAHRIEDADKALVRACLRSALDYPEQARSW